MAWLPRHLFRGVCEAVQGRKGTRGHGMSLRSLPGHLVMCPVAIGLDSSGSPPPVVSRAGWTRGREPPSPDLRTVLVPNQPRHRPRPLS